MFAGMERHFKNAFGKQLRKEFTLPDDLPYPMRKALEALSRPVSESASPLAARDDEDSAHSRASRIARDRK